MFELVHAERAELPVAHACRILGVSKSGYYRWLNAPPPTSTGKAQNGARPSPSRSRVADTTTRFRAADWRWEDTPVLGSLGPRPEDTGCRTLPRGCKSCLGCTPRRSRTIDSGCPGKRIHRHRASRARLPRLGRNHFLVSPHPCGERTRDPCRKRRHCRNRHRKHRQPSPLLALHPEDRSFALGAQAPETYPKWSRHHASRCRPRRTNMLAPGKRWVNTLGTYHNTSIETTPRSPDKELISYGRCRVAG